MRVQSGLAAFALSVGCAAPAFAQSIGPDIPEPEDVPGQRVIPEYAPIGYDLAGFDIFPTVAFGAKVDSNVFTRTSVRKSDLVLQAEPELRLRKRDKSNSIALNAGVRTSTYLRLEDQNATEYHFEGTVTRGTLGPETLTAEFGYRREAIQRGTVENDLARGEPLMRRVLHGSLMSRKQFNRLSLNAQGLLVHQRYEDIEDPAAGSIDQHFRNVTRYGLHSLASYEITGRSAIFGSLEYDHFDYALSPRLQNRDADSWSATVGLRYELSRVLLAQLGLGYRRYDFTATELGVIKGIAISGHLRYFPTRLLAIRGLIEQGNTTSPYDLVGAVTITTVRVEAEYEMRRNLSWTGAVRGTDEDYGKQRYSARRLEISAGPRLRFSRWLSADASFGYAKRFVKGAAPFEPYSQVYGMISATLAR